MRRPRLQGPRAELALDTIRSSCDTLEQLLAKYEFDAQADTVRELRLLDNAEERPEFLEELAGGAVFGAAGSVWDVEFPLEGVGRQTAVNDCRAFRTALTKLAQALLDLGFGDRRLRGDVETLKRWPDPPP